MILIDDSIGRLTGVALEQALSLLPAWRREQALRFRHENQQAQCAASYLLLCRALREKYGINEQPRFVYNEHGKPSLVFEQSTAQGEIFFSLSHCRKAVAVVVDSLPVGIDIEVYGRYHPLLADYVLNSEELASLPADATECDRRFTLLWTQKEAVAKLSGTGLQGAETIRALLSSHTHTLESQYHPHYVCSVARRK